MAETPNTVPIVSVVGKGDSGKTTFLEKLIPSSRTAACVSRP